MQGDETDARINPNARETHKNTEKWKLRGNEALSIERKTL